MGWATDSLVELDPLAPGLISRVLTGAPMVRQAIFTALATRKQMAADDEAFARILRAADDPDLALVLRDGRARDILDFVFGSVADGWLGALERLGGEPMKRPQSYVNLGSLFTAPEHRKKAEALRHVGQITEDMLSVVAVLDDRWLHHEALKRLPNTVAAKDFNAAIAFAQQVSSRATDDAIAEAIARLTPRSTISVLVQRFVRRADQFPPHPVAGDLEIRPIKTVRDIIEIARRYHNCILSKLEEVLTGRVAFAEYRRECIMEFRPLTQNRGWVLMDLHIERNGFISGELAAAARAKCDAIGIPRVGGIKEDENSRRYRRFMRALDLED